MKHVEFVSYTGKFPNLCSGELTLKIDGKVVTFGSDYTKCEYPQFWCSGGNTFIYPDEEGVIKEPWIIYKEDLPDKYHVYLDEIREEFNSSVPYGCCGGCI